MRAFCILVGLLLIGSFNQEPRDKQEGHIIKSFTSTRRAVIKCPSFHEFCEFDRRPILNTTAEDPDQGRLTYRYLVETGKIIGEGPAVIWNLEGAKVGEYKVTVVVENEKRQRASKTLTVRVEVCTSCDPPRPPVRPYQSSVLPKSKRENLYRSR